MTETERLTEASCRVTRILGGTEFICIRAVHDGEKQRSSQPSALGYAPRAERHYFVNRWPNRNPQP